MCESVHVHLYMEHTHMGALYLTFFTAPKGNGSIYIVILVQSNNDHYTTCCLTKL